MARLLLMFQLISPAYAEVDCLSGGYTGWRYRFLDDPIVTLQGINYRSRMLAGSNWVDVKGNCLIA